MNPPPHSFKGWTPIHAFSGGPEPRFLWSHLGKQDFCEPFFTQTITHALQSPLPKLLQRTTSLDELVAASEREPSVRPAGFIFHVSRCGSTLITQMLARLPQVLALSEPPPLASVISDPRLSDEDRQRAFRALVKLYSSQALSTGKLPIFKFCLQELIHWEAVLAAYPEVPRIVLHRNPVEVVLSNLESVSEIILSPLIAGTPDRPIQSLEEYAVFAFSHVYAAAVALGNQPGTLTLGYEDLPGAVEARILSHFGLRPGEDQLVRMREATRLYAKNPDQQANFSPDSAQKQDRASQSLRADVTTWIQPIYQELLSLSFSTAP